MQHRANGYTEEGIMSVRKRRWITRTGEEKTAWVVDYSSGDGTRHLRTFERKKDADAFHASVSVEVAQGTHTPPSKSPTVARAAQDWLAFVEGEGRERSTLEQYTQHVRQHIIPRIGSLRIAQLTTPGVQKFRDDLLADLSRPMARKVFGSLKSLLKDAKRRGNVAQNVAADVSIVLSSRDRPRLLVGRDIPSPDEIRRILAAAPDGRARALLMTAAFTGLRASELRGLRWADIDLKAGLLHVRQRADRFNEIGRPKSAAGERTVPLGPAVINTLRQWRLQCPKGEGDLVFPTGLGTIECHSNILQRIFEPVQIAAGVVTKEGRAKYTGLHSLRHFYASWCINSRSSGGLELPAKAVQARLGHSSIVMTLDRYGHLFPSHDDGAELAAAEKALLG
jgi:integrase